MFDILPFITIKYSAFYFRFPFIPNLSEQTNEGAAVTYLQTKFYSAAALLWHTDQEEKMYSDKNTRLILIPHEKHRNF